MGIFGKCRCCGADATGNYGGTDRLCDTCRDKERERNYAEMQSIQEEAIQAIAKKYECSIEAARLIFNRGLK